MAALDKLSALQVDVILLRETGIGREVNDKFLRLHADTVVRDRSRALVHSWKSLVQAKAPANVPAADAAAAESAVPDEGVAAEAEASAITPAADKQAAEADALDDGTATEVGRSLDAGTQRKRAGASQDEAPRKAKAAKGAKATPAPSPDGLNATLAALFSELAGFEFKREEKFKGMAYKKVAAVLLAHSEKITGGSQAALLPGVGKQSATKIQEYIDTGKIDRLERYHNGDLED